MIKKKKKKEFFDKNKKIKKRKRKRDLILSGENKSGSCFWQLRLSSTANDPFLTGPKEVIPDAVRIVRWNFGIRPPETRETIKIHSANIFYQNLFFSFVSPNER